MSGAADGVGISNSTLRPVFSDAPPNAAPSPLYSHPQSTAFTFFSLFGIPVALFREHWGPVPEFSSLTLRCRSLHLITKPSGLQISSFRMIPSNGLKNNDKHYRTLKNIMGTVPQLSQHISQKQSFLFQGRSKLWADRCSSHQF